jgi:hypothetical protein
MPMIQTGPSTWEISGATNSGTPTTNSPTLSPDKKFFYDGKNWKPVPPNKAVVDVIKDDPVIANIDTQMQSVLQDASKAGIPLTKKDGWFGHGTSPQDRLDALKKAREDRVKALTTDQAAASGDADDAANTNTGGPGGAVQASAPGSGPSAGGSTPEQAQQWQYPKGYRVRQAGALYESQGGNPSDPNNWKQVQQ